jgi:hypothetical protein
VFAYRIARSDTMPAVWKERWLVAIGVIVAISVMFSVFIFMNRASGDHLFDDALQRGAVPPEVEMLCRASDYPYRLSEVRAARLLACETFFMQTCRALRSPTLARCIADLRGAGR